MLESFSQKLTNPDEDFLSHLRMLAHMVPLVLGFVATLIFVISLVANGVLDESSALYTFMHWVALFSIRLIAVLIVLSIVVFQGLKIYVSVKLHKKNE